MRSEVQSFRLTYRGKPAGTHTLTTFTDGETTYMEGRMQLQGGLRQGTVQQRSRFHSRLFHSIHFEEGNLGRGDKRSFSIDFDENTGLIRARKGNDVAEQPYIKAYRDPLSMLHELRALERDTETLRIPMLGKDVTARMVGANPIDTPLGMRTARTYLLQPGASYVYLDDRAPHLILKLVQRLDEFHLDAVLLRVSQEESTPDWATEQQPKRRRSRRRRGRRGKSRGN